MALTHHRDRSLTSRVPRVRAWATAVAVALFHCGQPRGVTPSVRDRALRDDTHTSADAVGIARELLGRLRAHELPGGFDRTVASLDDLAEVSAATPAGRDVRTLRAELFAARYRITRARDDLARADAAYKVLEDEAGPTACSAIVAAADLDDLAGEHLAARQKYASYERRCATGSDLAHVHAALALLDPSVAHAEGEAQREHDAAASSAVAAPATPRFDSALATRIRRVVIDPGHGGSDPGARSATGLDESTVTLDVARRLADQLATQLGVEVLLTRDADQFVPLEDRTARANLAGADLFVSIHCNSAANDTSHGVATYVLDASNDRVAARIAARENGAVESDPAADPEVFRILANLRLESEGSRSTQLAAAIQRSIVATLARRYAGVADLGVHAARFHVLVGARMPAVLVELSFLSNPVDAERLREPAYRSLLATAIAHAIAGSTR